MHMENFLARVNIYICMPLRRQARGPDGQVKRDHSTKGNGPQEEPARATGTRPSIDARTLPDMVASSARVREK